MKILHPAPFAALALCFFAGSLRADEKPLREILRDGLYAEEVSRDPAAAAESYEELLSRYDGERDFAAAALFRLAEVRRKQDRKEDAIQLYQRLLAEFPQAENEIKLARENLTALGGKLPEAEMPESDPESKELARLQALAKTSPDLLSDPATLDNAVSSGFSKAVAFLLSAGADPFGGVALKIAAGSGNLAMVKQLLAAKTPVPEAVGQVAVNQAVRSDRGAVLAFLLGSGVRPSSSTLYDLLLSGVSDNAELLLKHGADPNAILPEPNGNPPRLLLNALIDQGRFEAASWLLDHGAKADIADDVPDAAPLYYAAGSGKAGCVEMMERLLKAGANPNRPSVPPGAAQRTRVQRSTPPPGETPMDTVLVHYNQIAEKVRILLAHGADPNLSGKDRWPLQFVVSNENFEAAKLLIDAGADLKKPGLLTPFLRSDDESNVEKLRFLLENGVDPNILDGIVKRDQTERDVDSFFEFTAKIEEYPILPINGIPFPGGSKTTDYEKQAATALELVRLMLDAGAKAEPFLGGLLYRVAVIDEKGEVFNKLLAQRPDKVPVNAFPDMERWQAVPRQMYLDQALVPALNELPNITLVDRDTGKRTTLAEGGEGTTLPATLDLLREKKDLMFGNQPDRWPGLTLVRRGEEKGVPFDLDGTAALPELRAGDVLEVRWSKPWQNRRDAGYWTSLRYDWSIEKRISFPIILEIDGKPREILLRGDLLSFDPTKAEAPRVDAASLIALFSRDTAVRKDSLVVKREGWSDVRLGTGEGFQLQKGDQLVFEAEPGTASQSEVDRVTLVSPGLPFSQSATVKGGTGVDASLFLPTLLQILTDAYAPKLDWKEIPRENDELFPWVANKEKSFDQVPVVLPHPDFSKIRIRRTDGDGKETILEVDLTEAIRRCTDATTPVEARAADVPLKKGDVVELPIVADRKDQAWNGFTAEETRFFHKALAGRVLINSGGGKIEQIEINYQPPEWRVSSHGILPLPPVEGRASTRLGTFLPYNQATIRREGAGTYEASKGTFVRDGDQIDMQSAQFPNSRAPRPRIIPPSAPSR